MPLRQRLKWALASYAAIALAAWLTLDGALRYIVLIVLAAFAAKCYIAVKREETQ